ncbi:MAG: hypothetical protein IT441_05325, partial [Phycisphaeraceae bacterium]|nr:hypothetical protein [Phycisphaeraceae bacterium]
GRSPIATRVVPPEKADEVYQFMVKRLDEGEQAYVVVPAIDPASEDSEGGTSGGTSGGGLKSVRAHVKLLADRYCRRHLVAAVHGRLKPQTRQAIMDKFRAGKIHVLVATTVIEVGVDVPNATVMIVEHAERFGLAQLHQLRGRVGRGGHRRKSVCVLVGDPATEDAQERLRALAATTDGFAIAEADLSIRGMGEFFGTRQSGAPPLRVANLPQDLDLLRMAKRDADAIVAADPDLHDTQWRLLRKTLQREHGQSLGLVDVG